ncbi:type VII secretion integral membrane protein EccD [Streptomyces sp. B6B3]|uniref:type VII secretion integral membrane protein EccD n=1 Tax=Streptomyces sp. B6B3 TaxID=3153570 RepID=UPI00325D2D28
MTDTLTSRSGRAATNPTPSTHPTPGPDRAPRTVEFVRIGLAGPTGRADLAVPATVPLARLLPMLLRQTGEDLGPDGGLRHGGWVLRRSDGTRLDAAASLADQGVAEGDLLFLGHGDDDATPPLYDDVVEVIGEHGVRNAWAAPAARRGAAALAVLALLAACGALAAAPGAVPGWLGLGTAVLALGVGVLMSRGFGDVRAGTLAAVLAVVPAVFGSVRLLGGDDGLGAEHLLLGCAVVAVVGALAPVLVGGGDGTFVTLVVAGPLAAVGAVMTAVWDVSPVEAASIAGPLALALTTVWPTLALRVARLPAPHLAATPEELERLPSQLAHDTLTARVAMARRVLGGMTLGSHLVAVGATLVLFAAAELWLSVLAGVLTVLMLLRARLFRESVQVATAMTAGFAAAAGAAVFTVADRASQSAPLLGAMLPTTLTVALAAGIVGLAAGRQRMNPRLSRALDMLETLLLVAVVPLVLEVWGLYGALLDWRV